MDHDWAEIGRQYEVLRTGTATRIDGPGYKIYRVGEIIRIDVSKNGN